MVARPAISLTTNRVPFPTTTGSTCSYASFARLIAETCNPALCANAEEPTYGACGFNGLFKTSATWLLTAVRRSRFPSGRQRNPIFNSRFGITVVRFVLPVRSPRPFNVPCTWRTPAITAAMLLATAQPVSSWQWIPSVASLPTNAFTFVTISATSCGSEPPLVSHITKCVAPFITAASTTRIANSGLFLYPSKKCSRSTIT